jgi:hypothetical protein
MKTVKPSSLNHWSDKGIVNSKYFPQIKCAVIEEKMIGEKFFSWIHHHETIHGWQHFFTPYGFNSFLLRRRQTDLAIKAFIKDNSIVRTDLQYKRMPPLYRWEALSTLDNKFVRGFLELEILQQCLDGLYTSKELIPHRLDLLKNLLIVNDSNFLPETIWRYFSQDPNKADFYEIIGKDIPLNLVNPNIFGFIPLHGRELLEAGAMVAQASFANSNLGSHLITRPEPSQGLYSGMRTVGNNYRLECQQEIRGAGTLYRIAQVVFLNSLLKHARDDEFLKVREIFSKRNYLNILLYELDSQPIDLLNDESYVNLGEYHILFCNIINIALMNPLSEPFQIPGFQLSWYDYHPGWRFVQLLYQLEILIEESIKQGKSLNDFAQESFLHPSTLSDNLCERLYWPNRIQLYNSLKNWIESGAGTFPYDWENSSSEISLMGCLDGLWNDPVSWHVSIYDEKKMVMSFMNQGYNNWPCPPLFLVNSKNCQLFRPFSLILPPFLNPRNKIETKKANLLEAKIFDFINYTEFPTLIYWYLIFGSGQRHCANHIASLFCKPHTNAWEEFRDFIQIVINKTVGAELPYIQRQGFKKDKDPAGGRSISVTKAF